MNQRLVLLISGLGLIMAIGSVGGAIRIGEEGPAWLLLGVIAATLVAFVEPSRAFAHGFVGGVVAGTITPLLQTLFFNSYLAHNPAAIEPFRQVQAIASPRVLVLIVTPMLGLATGIALGTMAWLASKALHRRTPAGA